MSWRLAKSLEKLRIQINAAYPNRSRVSDGTIGDQAHSARKSDHNPNAQGVVTAMDITHDPANGVDGKVLSRQLVKDSRVKYVIFGGEIYRTYKPKLDWAKYTGSNPHNHHIHVSVVGDANEYDDSAPWELNHGQSAVISRSTLRRGAQGPEVAALQRKLGIRADGDFGEKTHAKVMQFQLAHGLKADGIVGEKTRLALFGSEDRQTWTEFQENE